MKVVVSVLAGFCPGVRRAWEICEEEVKSGPVFTYGPLVHNLEMQEYLKSKHIYDINDSNPVAGTVVIRSHGVGPDVTAECESRGLRVVDATCPFVQKIHRIVADYSAKGTHIVIVGKESHPEILGIIGWVESDYTLIGSAESAKTAGIPSGSALVSQTTFNLEQLSIIIEILKTRFQDLVIFNTVCPSTRDRQQEVAQLAKHVDLMLVIGGSHSSNTKELVAICSQSGVRTHQIQTVNQLQHHWFEDCQIVGVAAGASTPEWIIREVVEVVKEIDNDGVEVKEESSEELEQPEQEEVQEQDQEQEQVKPIAVGDIVVGKVVQVNPDEVLVDIGFKLEGIITKDELSFRKVETCDELVKVDDSVEAEIIKLADDSLELSAKKVSQSRAWTKVKEAFENQTPLSAPVVEVVKGGIIVDLGLRGFMPASLVDLRFVEDLNQFLGQEITFMVIELERRRNKVIVSRKASLLKETESMKVDTLKALEAGTTVKGVVRRITSFGAFVDIGGIDGLIHISELAHHRVEHPSEVLSENQEIEVYVLKVDPEEERVSLSLKAIMADPWTQIDKKFKAGDVVEGKVVRLADFGAFVELIPGVDGLVHVSQISEEHVEKPQDVLTVDENIKVKILDIDPKAKRVSLSIREASRTPRKNTREEKTQDAGSIGATIGERLGNLFDQADE